MRCGGGAQVPQQSRSHGASAALTAGCLPAQPAELADLPAIATHCSYAVLVDGEEKKAGSLFEDFEPSINPPETIPDPEDKKPDDWVDEAR